MKEGEVPANNEFFYINHSRQWARPIDIMAPIPRPMCKHFRAALCLCPGVRGQKGCKGRVVGVFNGHFSMSCDRYHLAYYYYYYCCYAYFALEASCNFVQPFVLIGIYYLISFRGKMVFGLLGCPLF